MRIRLPAVLVAVLALVGEASGSGFLGSPNGYLFSMLKYRRSDLEYDPGPGDAARIRALDRALRWLKADFSNGITGSVLVKDRVLRILRSAFPGDPEFESVFGMLASRFEGAVRGDRDSLAATLEALPPGEARDAALLQLAALDRQIEAATGNPDRSQWHLSRAFRAIVRAERAVSGGRGDYFRARVPGEDPFRPWLMQVGIDPSTGDYNGADLPIFVRQDGSGLPHGLRSGNRDIYIWIGPPGTVTGPGTYPIATGMTTLEFSRVWHRSSEPWGWLEEYAIDGGEGAIPGEASGTLTIRTWLESAGIVEGSFSCTVHRISAPVSSSGAEDLRVEGDFRFTRIP